MKSKLLQLSGALLLLNAMAFTANAATLAVTSLADSGPGTLRAALASAADGDTVNFSVTGTIILTSGELLVTNNLTILGPGPDNLALDGNAASRVFHIGLNTVVNISGLTIAHGYAEGTYPDDRGGGILNDHATLTLSNSTLTANSSYDGGAILNDAGFGGSAFLAVDNCTLIGNFGDGGAIENGGIAPGSAVATINQSIVRNNSASGPYGGVGGGIYNGGTLTIANSTLSGNSAEVIGGNSASAYGGGILNYNSATLTITRSTITGNYVSGNSLSFVIGGGIFNGGTLRIANSTFTGNSANGGSGGGIYNSGAQTITDSLVSENVAFDGGGLYNDHTILIVSNCIVSGNSATDGGGIYNSGSTGGFVPSGIAILMLGGSTISGNSAYNGGGIENYEYLGTGTVAVTSSTISGNSARYGGGIYNEGLSFQGVGSGFATVTISDSTISGNSADGFGGGVVNEGGNTGEQLSAMLTMLDSTVNDNLAVYAGASLFNQNAFINVGSTILNAQGTNTISVASGAVTSLGYNLSSDDGGGFLTNSTDQINTDPLLGPLQDNGGPTFTHALLPGSPAIDKGTNFSGAANDQRGVGFARTVDNLCASYPPGGDGTDIGAFEVQISCSTNRPPVAGTPFIKVIGDEVSEIPAYRFLIWCSDPDNAPLNLTAVTSPSAMGAIVTLETNRVSYAPPPGFTGDDTFGYTITDGNGGFASGTALLLVEPRRLAAATMLPPITSLGVVQINFIGFAALGYAVERAESLDGPWRAIGNVLTDDNRSASFTDPNPPAGNAFYRAVHY